MTGWMLYQNDGFVTAHADTLISARVGNDISDILPVLHMVDDRGERIDNNTSGYPTVGLCQKIVIVSDSICFMWSGSLELAANLQIELSRLDRFYSKVQMIWYIRAICNNFKSDHDISAVILCSQFAPEMSKFYVNCQPFDVHSFGEACYGGSGGGELYAETELFISRVSPYLALEKYDRGEVSKQVSDSQVRLGTMDSILQFRALHNLLRHVATGGIIETLIIRNYCFSKMKTLYAIFFEERFDDFGFSPRFIVKRSYIDNYLAVSIRDYLNNTENSRIIGDPITWREGRPLDLCDRDPLKGEFDSARCIYFRQDGVTRSHYGEDPSIFFQNISIDPLTNRPVMSDWYIKDAKEKRKQTDLYRNVD